MPTMYTATASGRRARTVNCEHCGYQFAYFVQRGAQATAMGTGLFFLIDPRFWKYGGYDGLAQARAERQLAKALEREIDPVLCPECGRLQANMESILRRRLAWDVGSQWIGRGVITSVIGLGLLAIALPVFLDESLSSMLLGPIWLAVAALVTIAGLGMVSYKFICQWQYQPDFSTIDPEWGLATGSPPHEIEEEEERERAEEESMQQAMAYAAEVLATQKRSPEILLQVESLYRRTWTGVLVVAVVAIAPTVWQKLTGTPRSGMASVCSALIVCGLTYLVFTTWPLSSRVFGRGIWSILAVLVPINLLFLALLLFCTVRFLRKSGLNAGIFGVPATELEALRLHGSRPE